MKVLVCNQPGEFEYRSMPEPILKKGEAIVRIKRIGVCGTDLHAFEGTQPYFSYPRILGHELAAEIVECPDLSGFTTGENISVLPYLSCGKCIACVKGKTNCCSSMNVLGVHSDGGMAEYLSVPYGSLIKADGLNEEELAMVEPLAVGAHGVGRAMVEPGDFVLIAGAGPIGVAAMEFARLAGGQVIVVDINEQRLRFCRDHLGVKHIINASTVDSVQQVQGITGGNMAQVVIDATGSLTAINHGFQFMAHGGRYVLIGLQKGNISFSHPEFHKREGTLLSSRNATRADFEFVMKVIRSRDVKPTSWITHRLEFDAVKSEFSHLLDPKYNVLKAMIRM
jgi:2-desacetyl-2-hydroxyethyl bacteriochlorophyllide A dehydrogenase